MPNDVRDLPASNDGLYRFLGGSPLAVAFRLILLSILVGVVLAAIGFDPWNILHSIQTAVPAAVGSRLRRRQLAVALLPARRRDRDPDLAAVAAVRQPARAIGRTGKAAADAIAICRLRRRARFRRQVQHLLPRHGRPRQFPDRLRRVVAAGAEASRHRARGHRPDPDHAFPWRSFWRLAVPAAGRAVHAAHPPAGHRRARRASRPSSPI